VGNREDLLGGAKRCLFDKGYARTTARDIATASGTSLAAIGYHFRTTEALLNAALFEALGEFGAELERALSVEDGGGTPYERFERYWSRVIDSMATHRQLWAATVEILPQVDRLPELRTALGEGLQNGRLLWASLLQRLDPAKDAPTAQAVGSFYQALLSGVLVQWLVDPDRAPSSQDLAGALRFIADNLDRSAS
jgi:AcrR family transcriptional regulator